MQKAMADFKVKKEENILDFRQQPAQMVPKHKELKNLKDQLKQEIKHQRQNSNGAHFNIQNIDPTTNPSTQSNAQITESVTSPSMKEDTQALELQEPVQAGPRNIHKDKSIQDIIGQNLTQSQFGQIVRQNIQSRLPGMEETFTETAEEDQTNEMSPTSQSQQLEGTQED